jgi:flagellar M-ring protein FliF
MDSIKKALAPVLAQLQKLSPRMRMLAGVIATLGILAAVALALVGAQPKRVLFSGLDAKDAAAVVAALDQAKIEYELGEGGSTVRVNDGDVDRARLMLAEQDLPSTGNVGFEMFEEQSFGLTDFAQQVNYRRALQGELERTIGQIDAVAAARVHVTQPRKAVFEDEKIAPTASVTVELVRGRELDDRSVGAIRHLVASAVEGLEPGGVTVVDTKGNLLSRAGSGGDAASAALDYENDLELRMADQITRLLERTVGVGGAQVQVAAEVDFSKIDTTEEVYDPEQIAVRSESTQEMVEGAGAGRPGGVAGAQANTPGADASTVTPDAKGSSRLVQSKQYEVNKTVVRTSGPGATLKRLTVAVLVDGTYTTPEDGGEPVFTPRSEEDLAQLQAVVENAMGFNTARGDRIKLASVQFHDRPVIGDIAAPAEDALMAWLPYAAGGGLALLLVIAWLVVSRRKSKRQALQPEVLSLPATVQQAQAALRGEVPALPEAKPDAIASEQILALAAGNPELTADVIRAWIASDGE